MNLESEEINCKPPKKKTMKTVKWALGLVTTLSATCFGTLHAAIMPDADTILYVSGDTDYGLGSNSATAEDKLSCRYSKNDRLVTDGAVGAKILDGMEGDETDNGGFLCDTNDKGMSAEFAGASSYIAGDFTFECFLRLDVNGVIDGNYGYIARHGNAWMLGFYNANGEPVLYDKSWKVLARPNRTIKDGQWHHLAVVQDRTKGIMNYYLDYELVGTGSYTVPLDGNTPDDQFRVNCWSWDGEYNFTGATKKMSLDELRLVKRALTPEEFLMTPERAEAYVAHAAKVKALTDADTLVYFPATKFSSANINELAEKDPSKPKVSTVVTVTPTIETAAGLETFYATATADGQKINNDTSCHIVAKSLNAGSAYMQMDDDSFMDDDFTLEFFFKYSDATRLIKDASLGSCYLAYFAPMFYFASWDGTKINFNAGGSSAYTPTTADGKWHHYAAVWEKESLTLRMYFDGWLLLSKTFDSYPAHGADAKKPLYLGSGCWGNRAHDVGDGSYDEIRLTQRALSPLEFMSKKAYPVLKDSLAYLNFETDVSAGVPGVVVSPLGCSRKSNAATFAQKTDDLFAAKFFATAMAADESENAGALLVDLGMHANGNTGGGYVLTDPTFALSTGDFTVETFFKAGDWSDYYGFIFNCADSWSVYLTNAENPVLGCKVAGLEFRGSTGLLDGNWHHLAVVADQRVATVTIYLDYQVFHRFTGVTDPLATGKTRPTTLLFGGGVEGTYGLTQGPSKCRYDEFRVTKRALKVTEFLTDERLSVGDTCLWGRFENASLRGDVPAGRYALVAELAGNALLQKSSRARPSRNVYVEDGAEVTANAYGARLEGGTLTYPGTGVLDQRTATTEFFVRSAAGSATAAAFAAGGEGWTLTTDAKLSVTVGDSTKTFDLSVSPFDGLWHHVAVETEADNGATAVKVFVDHSLACEASVMGVFAFVSPASLTFGSDGFVGGVDEVRVNRVALDAAKLMSCDPQPGFMFIFR